MTSTAEPSSKVPRGEAYDLRLLCLAAVVGLLPFTVYSTHLVDIAADVGTDASVLGVLRGVGGVAAFVTGVAVAPLLDRLGRTRGISISLGLLALVSLAASYASIATALLFCLGVGTAIAMLTPSLLAAAADRHADTALAGRAATTVTAAQSLGAVLAGPLVGVLATWGGWRGCLLVVAGVAIALAGWVVLRRPPQPAASTAPLTHRASFALLMRDSVARRLVVIATLRTAGLMGYLAYLAVAYTEYFDTTPQQVTMVWTISGAGFFVSNLVSGRWVNVAGKNARPYVLLTAGVTVASIGTVVVFTTTELIAALASTALISIGHAATAAAVTSLIVARAEGSPTQLLSVTAAGMSLGVFIGAGAGGLGLALYGLTGAGICLAAITALAGVIGLSLRRTASPPAKFGA
ncbi:MFS transporter [Nocardioidaceae bacterium SCSIO 66511]|nr:MFS transporter [Nocardioidaceae bacterium SCSIO 66511]